MENINQENLWIIGIGNSLIDNVDFKYMYGSEKEVKEHLFKLVQQYVKSAQTTTNIDEIYYVENTEDIRVVENIDTHEVYDITTVIYMGAYKILISAKRLKSILKGEPS